MNNYGRLLHSFNEDDRRVIRNLESIKRKLNNCHNAVMFNSTCIKENLLPTYSNIKLHNEAVQHSRITENFRRNLVKQQLDEKTELLAHLKRELDRVETEFTNLNISQELRNEVNHALGTIIEKHSELTQTKTIKKLSNLYGGHLALPKPSDSFINLSSKILTENEMAFLNLGINCHLYPKYSQVNKKINISLLYDDLCKLEKNNDISINPNLQAQLQSEGTKKRQRNYIGILTPELKNAAKSLREDENIIIRKADKSATYVIMDGALYMEKCNVILSDNSKFSPVNRNPVMLLQKKVNNLVNAANAEIGSVKFQRAIGDYDPGYFYGNVKTHKPENPLRPIISQIPSPTYQLAKTLNELIRPFIPSKYSIKSTAEFVDTLKINNPHGVLASLDVESLFTNVPVDRTIAIILDYVYNNTIPPLKIPRNILKEMLEVCTKEAVFRAPNGALYLQHEGIAMGSPLGVLFAESFMSYVEGIVLSQPDKIPYIYCRYVDDIFVCAAENRRIEDLKTSLEQISGLNLTIEYSEDNKIPFLDVLVEASPNFSTTVYRKPTDANKCLNGISECTDRYKSGVVAAYVHRALKVCSTWEQLHSELKYVRQMVINNYYTNSTFDEICNRVMNRYIERSEPANLDNVVKVFYENIFTSTYKLDEKVMQDIINTNCKPTDPNKKLKLIIYYKNPSSFSLICRNNINASRDKLSKSNVVYQYSCKTGDCATRAVNYVGYTTCKLTRRLTYHLQHGSIKDHHRQYHNSVIDRTDIVNNTTILAQCSKQRKLETIEAVYIKERSPVINIQHNAVSRLPLYTNQAISTREVGCNERNVRPPSNVDTAPPPQLRRSARIRNSNNMEVGVGGCNV